MDLTDDYEGYRDIRSRSPVDRNQRIRTTTGNSDLPYSHREAPASPGAARQQPQQQKQIDEPLPGTVVFVTGLSTRTANTDLEAIFSKQGGLTKVSVIYDPHSRESRGFAFVNFEQPSDAEVAIRNVNGIEIDGRTIKAELAKRRRPRTPTPGRYFGEKKRGPDPRVDPYPRQRPIPDYRDAYRDSFHQDPYYRSRGGYSPPPPPYRYDRYPPARDPYARAGYERRSPPPPPPRGYDRTYDRRSPPRHQYLPTSTGMHYDPNPRPRY